MWGRSVSAGCCHMRRANNTRRPAMCTQNHLAFLPYLPISFLDMFLCFWSCFLLIVSYCIILLALSSVLSWLLLHSFILILVLRR
ncbi:hypothetical protein B0H17DRAFT_1066124 [Mycena rosella]|uniref:Uncharacterized protein n=1 Tax=Mycena rosella TaxID=1033263 RepID=A0AAD7DEZ4_MYCRO|nr:hypothetical protein B0H17DRAFT_1066124 [Mycena rosella]